MEFLPKASKSIINCCVYGCNSCASKNDSVRFFNFPEKNESVVIFKNKFNQDEKLDRFDVWVKVLKMGKTVSKTMRVCSLHFVTDDLVPSNHQVRRLKETSIPSVNLPSSSIDTTPDPSTIKQTSERLQRLHNRSIKKEQNFNNIQQDIHHSEVHSSSFKVTEDSNALDNEEEENKKITQCLTAENNDDIDLVTTSSYENVGLQFKDAVTQFPDVQEVEKQFRDVSIQVSTDSITSKFSNFITTEDELSTMTGIPNFNLLKTIKQLVDRKKASSSHLNSKFENLEIIVMTFVKLKQNMSYAELSVLFKTGTPETCRGRILGMIDTLYKCLKHAIYWPSKNNISKNIPQCFKEFSNVRTVVDCIEIPIQKFKNLSCYLNTYSYYKSCYTIKFMTAVTPAGLISFISKPYGGRASDNFISEQSGILLKIDKNDDLMADRGFTVNELCKRHDVNLIIPPFSKQKKQFSQAEAIKGGLIAKARVHTERTTIACAIVNLSSPILKNDKFV